MWGRIKKGEGRKEKGNRRRRRGEGERVAAASSFFYSCGGEKSMKKAPACIVRTARLLERGVAFLERSAPAWNVESQPPRGLRTRGSQSRGRLGANVRRGNPAAAAAAAWDQRLFSSLSSFPWFDLPRLRLFHQARILSPPPPGMDDLHAPHSPTRPVHAQAAIWTLPACTASPRLPSMHAFARSPQQRQPPRFFYLYTPRGDRKVGGGGG